MKKHCTNLLIASLGLLMLCIQPALAGHPLLQNGWLKSATENSLTIDIPQGGEMTFTYAPTVKIQFADGVAGTAADLQTMASQIGKQRIIVNIRRDVPESSTAVIVGIKAPKPAPAAAAPVSSPAPDAAPAAE